MVRSLSLFVSLAFVCCAVPVSANERHAGYYYPKPVTTEAYRSRTRTLPDASRQARVAFVTSITKSMTKNCSSPLQFAMYSKGSRQQKLIIVGLRDDAYNTIFRARALLAQLTAVARTIRLTRERMKPSHLTFLDFLNLMGFEQLTVSDGKEFSHQITIR